MALPVMNEDQRVMIVELLANALRKDEHLRNRAAGRADPGMRALAERRGAPSARYVDGMLDLIKVLFAHGPSVAASCLDQAVARVMQLPATTDKPPEV